jgi:hypothetical protein
MCFDPKRQLANEDSKHSRHESPEDHLPVAKWIDGVPRALVRYRGDYATAEPQEQQHVEHANGDQYPGSDLAHIMLSSRLEFRIDLAEGFASDVILRPPNDAKSAARHQASRGASAAFGC